MSMRLIGLKASSVLIILLTSMSASAITSYSPVDFSSQANFTWIAPQTDPNGTTATYFPGGPSGSVTLGGIPFNISSNTAGFQAWNGYVASGGGNGTVSMTMPVGIYGATDVYTLINTYWGTPGGPYTTLVFTGSAGAMHTVYLFGDSDIRNWCCGGTINGTSTINVHSVPSSPLNGQTGFLDMQHIVLPAAFATQTLVSIQLIDSGSAGLQRTVLDGVTVASTVAGPVTSTNIWVGLANSDDAGIRFDLRAEVYRNGSELAGAGEVASVAGGSSGFNNAHERTIDIVPSPGVVFSPGDTMNVALYVRNACAGSGKNSGRARLWYNDSAATSRFAATIGSSNTYFLLDGFSFGASPGGGPKKTIDVQAGPKCSPYKPFGTWSRPIPF